MPIVEPKDAIIMERLYVSLPCDGRRLDDVRRMCDAARTKYGTAFHVVTPLDVVEDWAMPENTSIGKRIEALLTCNHAVFLSGWADTNECNLEFQACLIYNIDYRVDTRI